MALEKIKNLFAQLGIVNFAPEERTEFIESSVSNISFLNSLNKKKIEDWDAYFIELATIAETKPADVGFTISKVINGEAPFEVRTEILNRGYSLNDYHVIRRASRFSVSELEKLENYGMDFSSARVLGSALSNPNKEQIFDYLLAKNQWGLSYDEYVLKDILERSSILRLAPYFARQVIDKGAPVTDDTASWIEGELKQTNLLFYLIIKEEIKQHGLD